MKLRPYAPRYNNDNLSTLEDPLLPYLPTFKMTIQPEATHQFSFDPTIEREPQFLDVNRSTTGEILAMEWDTLKFRGS